jgi:hypothetical protein
LPKAVKKSDFQDYPMWREFNYSMLKYISSQYCGTIFEIAATLNIKLLPDNRGALKKAYEKIKTQIKHIRF